MEEPELMIGPVAEALGVSRAWLIGSDEPLPEFIDMPVGLMVELMDAADVLYPTEEQRWRQLRQWLSRLTGRPAAEFERAAPLMEAVRRQYRLTRDEDLQAVSVWRRLLARPAETSQLQLTVRPENGARLRRLVEQLGSEEAAIDFLLQMDDNCGKGAALRRTRWPPKVHYESARGQVKIDVGTEMVCVVLSQFKPAPARQPEPEPEPEPLPAPPAPEQTVEVESTPAEVLVQVNGHVPSAPGSARPAGGPTPLSLASSAYQVVARDATLPAQMFADDDPTAEQLSEVQHQLTSVLHQLGEDSNQMDEMGALSAGQIVAEEIVGEQEIVGGEQEIVGGEQEIVGDEQEIVGGEQEIVDEEVVAGQEVAPDAEEMGEAAAEGFIEQMTEVAPAEAAEAGAEPEEMVEEMPAPAATDVEVEEEAEAPPGEAAQEPAAAPPAEAELPAAAETEDLPGEQVVVTEVTAEQVVDAEPLDVEPLVELPEQLMADAEDAAAQPGPSDAPGAVDADELPDADEAQDEPMAEAQEEPMEVADEDAAQPGA